MTASKFSPRIHIPATSGDQSNRNMVTHRDASDPVIEQLNEYIHRIEVSYDEAHARALRFRIQAWLDWIRNTGRRFESPQAAAEAYASVLYNEYDARTAAVRMGTIHDFIVFLEGGGHDE